MEWHTATLFRRIYRSAMQRAIVVGDPNQLSGEAIGSLGAGLIKPNH